MLEKSKYQSLLQPSDLDPYCRINLGQSMAKCRNSVFFENRPILFVASSYDESIQQILNVDLEATPFFGDPGPEDPAK